MANNQGIRRAEAGTPRRAEEEFRAPAVDVYETEDRLVLIADMPGVAESGMEVSVEEDTLSIIGRPAPRASAPGNVMYSEFAPLPFRRVFTLSDDIRRDGIEGKIRDGVLRLNLPKAEQAKVRRIPITSP